MRLVAVVTDDDLDIVKRLLAYAAYRVAELIGAILRGNREW
jgi:hypothetical protein